MYLFIDVETRSELDIEDVGAYKYAKHKSTELILFSYSFGFGSVKTWEPMKKDMPKDLRQALEDPLQIIVAWNSQFERLICKYLLGIDIPVERFIDPMILSRYMSMPGRLERVGQILNIKNKKLTEFFIKDQSLVDLFCTPLRVGGYITLFGIEPTQYRDWDTHPKEWEKFIEYNQLDVMAMQEIFKRLRDFPLPDFEYELFALNEKINDYGLFVDSMLLQGAVLVVEKEQEKLKKEFLDLTGISKPKSTKAVLRFVRGHGYTFPSIGKAFVNRALAGECNLDEVAKHALKLRIQLGKSSVSKLEAIQDALEEDGRVRGLFNFMGAARTGRWTSGLIQMQNLAKASKEVEKKYSLALELLRKADYESVRATFSSPTDVAVAALRPIFRAPNGKKFAIADLASIETRGAAWVAGCSGLLKTFNEHELDCYMPMEDHSCCKGKDPYLSFAALMDGHASYLELWEEFKKGNKSKRTNAKPPTLGCGYGLGVGEITQDEDGNKVSTGLLGYADSMGIELTPEYAEKAVMVYRNSYPEIPQFWYLLQEAFVRAVEHEEPVEVGPLRIEKKGRVVNLWLPSGRALHYINPQITYVDAVSKRGNPYKRAEITIEGVDQKTHQWTRINTWGGKIFENVVQAICRDILGCGMLEADKRGFNIVLSCHDEIVAEVPENGDLGVEDLIDAMVRPVGWAEGFPLAAEGFESDVYKKDG